MAGSTAPAVHPTPPHRTLSLFDQISLDFFSAIEDEREDLFPVSSCFQLLIEDCEFSEVDYYLDFFKMDCCFYNTCDYNEEGIKFSAFPSQTGGTDIKVGSTTIYVPEHCSVRHPAVQMVLFAKVILDSFYCPQTMVPRGIIDLIKKSSSDKCSNAVQTYKAGWADARGHSTKSHNGDAISHLRPQKVDHQNDRINWGSLPVLLDVSIMMELPPSDETQEACSMDTAGAPAVDNAGTVADFMQWHCRPEGEVNVQAQEKEQQCKVKNLDTYALATTEAQTPGDGNRTPALWLDSGAGHHCVGDASVLCNLRNPPAGTAIRVADGFRLPVTKIGDIQTESFQIADVYLVPGLQMNVISVRQLAKCKIFPTFYENHADLYRDGEQVGGAIVDDNASIYRLYYLAAVGNAEASTS